LPAKVAGDISAKEAERLWTILAGDDAVAAYRAISLLAAAPAPTLALLKEHVQPPPPLDVQTTLNLIKELDSEVFRTREKATQALIALGEPAEEMLVKALKDNPPLEARMRLEMVLAGQAKLNSGMLQQYRAIEVLEQIGSPAAKEILEKLAKGQANTRLTQEAQATLKRLSKGP
jgi:HEAT repeat protein